MGTLGTSGLQLVRAGEAEKAWAINVWVTFAAQKYATDKNWGWKWFVWDQIIPHPAFATVAAKGPNGFVEGLMAYSMKEPQQRVKVDFIATAPWNYGKSKIRKGVGPALLSFAIEESIAAGFGGALVLNAIPEAETFYDGHNFERTGNVDAEKLAEFIMPPGRKALNFVAEYPAIRFAK